MSGQYCLDANVFINSWHDTYSIHIFASLWEQIVEHKDEITLIEPVYAEIEPISPQDQQLDLEQKKEKYPLRMWLIEKQFQETAIELSVERRSIVLEQEYEINDGPRGANKNDIKLIAYSEMTQKTVVTLEKRQPQVPDKKSNYKIPLICSEQDVQCVNFIEMLEGLGIRV